jgi:hypothetical protein
LEGGFFVFQIKTRFSPSKVDISKGKTIIEAPNEAYQFTIERMYTINKSLIEKFSRSESKLLAVTKYWNADETQEIVSQFDEVDILIGL